MVNSIEDLRQFLLDYFYSKSPGVFILLDRICKDRLGVSLIDAVFHMPDKLYDLILDVYRDSLTANFIFKSFILKPISLKLDNNITVDELYEVARNGAEKLKDILAKGGIDTCKMCKSDNSNKTCEKV